MAATQTEQHRATNPGRMGDTLKIQPTEGVSQGSQKGDAIRESERDAAPFLDKNARPAGRRFQSFTPPEVGSASLSESVSESTLPWWAFVLRRKRLLIVLALATAGGLVVAMSMKIHVLEKAMSGASVSSSSIVATPLASGPLVAEQDAAVLVVVDAGSGETGEPSSGSAASAVQTASKSTIMSTHKSTHKSTTIVRDAASDPGARDAAKALTTAPSGPAGLAPPVPTF